jgi:hypothetical protein
MKLYQRAKLKNEKITIVCPIHKKSMTFDLYLRDSIAGVGCCGCFHKLPIFEEKAKKRRHHRACVQLKRSGWG